MMKRMITAAIAALVLPAAAQAKDKIVLDKPTVDYLLKAWSVKCDELGRKKEDDDSVIVACTNGQKYAVIVVDRGGEEKAGVIKWNHLTNKWEAMPR
jgi:hypothetical protein